MGTQQTISIGVIGAGTITQSVHLTSLQRAGFDIRIVCDLSNTRAHDVASRCGARATTFADEVLASEVDAVLIATPGSHAELTKKAVQAEKHVLAEKPLAYTVSEVDDIRQLATRNSVVVQVGYMKEFDPLMSLAREQYRKFNGVRLAQITVAHPADAPQVDHLRLSGAPADVNANILETLEWDDFNRAQRALPTADEAVINYYKNVLNGSIIHELTVFRSLGIQLPDHWEAQLVTELTNPFPASVFLSGLQNQSLVALSWNWLPDYPEYSEQLRVLASNGRIRLEMAKPYLQEARSSLTVETSKGAVRESTQFTSNHESGFLRQLDGFRAAIRSGEATVANLSSAREDIVQLQRMAKAIAKAQGSTISIEADQ